MSIAAIANSTGSMSAADRFGAAERPSPIDQAGLVRDVFRSFVGETFYRQMLKSMRETVGKPAYFHGGRGEEVFTAQLDQTLAETLSAANGSDFSDGMFAHAFPHLAAVLKEAEAAAPQTATDRQPDRLDDLVALPRR